MTDRILLAGLRGRGYHGVLPEEKRRGQDFMVDLTLLLDARPAAATDDLAHTVNYAEIAQTAVDVIKGESRDLIETVATEIADRILEVPLVEGVEVVLHKPSAPIKVPFGDVSVIVRRERAVPAVVALGANLGLREHTLAAALRELDATEQTRVVAVSDLFESEPVGGVEQPDYLNAVALVQTRRWPHSLLRDLMAIEQRHGRKREVRWGPRTLDMDLIALGHVGEANEGLSRTEELMLPHPRATERGFVMTPWAQIAPSAFVRSGEDVVTVADAALSAGAQGLRPGPEWPAGVPGR